MRGLDYSRTWIIKYFSVEVIRVTKNIIGSKISNLTVAKIIGITGTTRITSITSITSVY